ncbi:hypothetical protein, partial [Endozoicomonas sp. YOMI1]|uniref:hypothetical protein n=1 Tax=Endozoicomonas sp. YOMI1 TaxID=2828739 RepID=UPI002147DE20
LSCLGVNALRCFDKLSTQDERSSEAPKCVNYSRTIPQSDKVPGFGILRRPTSHIRVVLREIRGSLRNIRAKRPC